jgi:hypothetical protein
MPKYAKGDECHLYVDLSYAERDRFKAACKANDFTMVAVVRHMIRIFCETAEADAAPEQQASTVD